MPKYTCNRCLKEFSQKSHYNKHLKKKLPCQDNKGKIDKGFCSNLIVLDKQLNIKKVYLHGSLIS